mgnify:CR=1 FL=1
MGYARFDCPECGEVEDPLLHTVNSTCGGRVAWVNGALRCEECGHSIYHFRCSTCGERPSMSECTNGPTSPTRRERAQAEREEEAEREGEEERRREANHASDAPSEAPSGDTKGCRAIPGALGATVVSGGLLALFVMIFGSGNWGYPGWCCCSLVGFAMLATLGAWQSVFK